MSKEVYKYQELTRTIIGAGYKVHNTLGTGFLEKVYHNALLIELRKAGLNVESEKPINVYYDGQLVGEYYADIVVNSCIIIEVKATSAISPAHETQVVNYLKAAGIDFGLLLNFGQSFEVKRKAFELARMFKK